MNKFKVLIAGLIVILSIAWIAMELQLIELELPFMPLIFGLIGLKILIDSINESD
ncbi:MAG: hypothetical protein JW703_03450 [Candidatus Diapherotrites archaeon]|nr:hypothetical protein [Candidatus Diapherotrites archaeon]